VRRGPVLAAVLNSHSLAVRSYRLLRGDSAQDVDDYRLVLLNEMTLSVAGPCSLAGFINRVFYRREPDEIRLDG
jgi:hypothetical protein